MTDETSQWATERRERARELRERGWSYEAIAAQVSNERGGVTTPWGVYADLHPEKTPDQIREWMQRHHPNRDAWAMAYYAEHDPDALRRMEEADAREERYLASLPEGALDYPPTTEGKE